MEEAVEEDGRGGLADVGAVEREDRDQRSLRTADPAGQRDEVAELADEIAEHQRSERWFLPDRGEAESQRRDVERHVGK